MGCPRPARRGNRTGVLSGAIPSLPAPGRGRAESAEEIMNILEAYDLTGALRDAAELAGCSRHTVARHAAERERSQAGRRAAGMIDEFMPKLEELIKRSQGEDPRRRGIREDHRDRACRVQAHHTAGGGAAEGSLAFRPATGVLPSGPRAWDAGAVRLRRRPRIGATATVPDAMKAPAADDAWHVGGARVRAGQAVTASPAARLTGSGTRAGPAGLRHGQRSGLSFMIRS